MGSLLNCCLTGYLCRLCSGLHKKVIHIYGREGQILLLSQKINDYLPVTVSASDPLPKTICFDCKIKVDQHHQLIKMIKENTEKFKLRQLLQEADDSMGYVSASSSTVASSTSSIPNDCKDESDTSRRLSSKKQNSNVSNQ